MGANTDLPVGPPVPDIQVEPPPHEALHGKTVSLVPLSSRQHAPGMYKWLGGAENVWRWTYMLSPGFQSQEQCDQDIAKWASLKDPQFYAIVLRKEGGGETTDKGPNDGEAVGMMSYLAITPAHRRVEIGSIILGDAVAGTKAATEAYKLLIGNAFALGYQRVEWKANALNKKSLKAAKRLGFVFEGIFRKHMVIQGRERDTAYFSITNDEWNSGLSKGFDAWLEDDNFDESGRQRRKLEECREAATPPKN